MAGSPGSLHRIVKGSSVKYPITWLMLLSVAVAGFADEETLPLEPERTLEFTVTEATWLSLDVAPDGQELVLEILGDLYLLPIAGGDARAITEGMAYDSQPKFSPDGDHVAFISDRDGREAVWIMERDGANPKKIGPGDDRVDFASPNWSPDGQHVIVSRTTWGLRTFELWAYHIDGGKGVQVTHAKGNSNTPVNQRHNALGATYSPDGRYLYYARKNGGFGYNLRFPLWQIARRDLREDVEDILTRAQGSAIRPVLSPDGGSLVYGTRYEQQTGLRIRDLNTGEDDWLVYPVQRDDQEARFTRDLLPGYAFMPDGLSVIYTAEGDIRQVTLSTREVSRIPFSADVKLGLGPRLNFPHRLGVGPVKARLIRDPAVSPDGERLAFSAFTRIHIHTFATGETQTLTPEDMQAFHPTWSPDSRHLAFVDWSSNGGHIWRMRANGRGNPRQLTEHRGHYTDPAWSRDGERLVALRATGYERLYREADFGAPVGSDVVWLPASGGAASVVIPSRGYGTPHFGPEADRIYLYLSGGAFANNDTSGLTSIRYDGTDRHVLLQSKGPGIYFAEEAVGSEDVRIAPDGHHVLIHHANQLYLVRLLNAHLRNVSLDIKKPSMPLTRLTDVGADFFGWADNGKQVFWSTGHQLYQRAVADVSFEEDEDDDAENGDDGDGADDVEPLMEAHESVSSIELEVYRPRYRPEGRVALVGATVLSMEEGAVPIEDAVVLIDRDRIAGVGVRADVALDDDVEIIDVTGKYILPGFVDTHAHYRPLRRVLDTNNASFLANLAYGVTTGLDVQPSTVDILSYEDLLDAGMMIGPRALSTGPGIFSNNEFRSREHAEAVLTRYKEHYRVRNLKAYISGNRKQRQWLVQAAKKLQLMPTTEGSLDMKLDMTHAIDGFRGNEHNFPIIDLYDDTVQLVAQSGMSYTPTLLVTYGGPSGENFYYTNESPHEDAKLRRFTPAQFLAARTLRRPWFHEREYTFSRVAAQAAKIIRAGGRVGVGAHGQLQGLGYHWELWAIASGGLTPLEALTAATRHGAEIIGVAEDIGTIAQGKLADLVVLNSDPLLDVRNTQDLQLVVKGGQVFEAATLDQVWPQQRPLPDQWWWHTGPNPQTTH